MIQFGSPNWLWMLAALPLLVLFFRWRQRKQEDALARFAPDELYARLIDRVRPEARRWKRIMALLAFVLIVVSLARPQYGVSKQIVKRTGMDIVVALDTSDSMLAEDLRPNRLRVARREIVQLIDHLQGDRIALVPFAGDAFVQCPLTLDYGAAKMFLQEGDTNTVSIPGTALGKAIQTASRCFVQEERKYKVMILITDGEDTVGNPGPIEAAKEAARQGVRIYTIGVGDPEGVPIPIRDRSGQLLGYKEDKEGDKVLSKLDENALRQIATETDGNYFRATADHFEIQSIYDDIAQLEEKEIHSTLHLQGIDRFQYVLTPALLLLILELFALERGRKAGKRRRVHEDTPSAAPCFWQSVWWKPPPIPFQTRSGSRPKKAIASIRRGNTMKRCKNTAPR
jgi:Ca-activated chloride channel family protein